MWYCNLTLSHVDVISLPSKHCRGVKPSSQSNFNTCTNSSHSCIGLPWLLLGKKFTKDHVGLIKCLSACCGVELADYGMMLCVYPSKVDCYEVRFRASQLTRVSALIDHTGLRCYTWLHMMYRCELHVIVSFRITYLLVLSLNSNRLECYPLLS